jgi:hypothetical protein
VKSNGSPSLTEIFVSLNERGWQMVGSKTTSSRSTYRDNGKVRHRQVSYDAVPVTYDRDNRFSPYPWVSADGVKFRSSQVTPLLDDSDLDGLTSGLSKFDRYAGLLVHAMLAGASVCGWKVRVEIPDPFIFITDNVLVDGDIAHRCPNCAAIISGEPIVLETLQESA